MVFLDFENKCLHRNQPPISQNHRLKIIIMSGDFWMIRNREDIKTRLQSFERFLIDEWNWSEPVAWKVETYSPKRSLSQNDLFHKWCREIALSFTERGRSTTESMVKDGLKLKYLGTTEKKIGNRVLEVLRETTSLSVGEMYQFMSQVQAWAIDMGVDLTHPQNSEYMKLQRGEGEH